MYKLGCPESPPNVLVCELNLLVENVLLSGDMTDARSLLRGLRGRIRGVEGRSVPRSRREISMKTAEL